ncbi:glycoside hydrolase family 172 protein [Planctomycetota bacterium]
MRTVTQKIWMGLCWIGLILPVQAGEPISIKSLLQEMVDRDAVARFPDADFRLKQHSSYNRASKTPDEPEGWFNNFDRSTSDDHHNFIRTETTNGRKEWVVMEDLGPGAITRIWIPWRNQLKPGSDIIIRFYIDGFPKPALEGNIFELFQGKGLVPFPLAHESLRSAVSFFPIPYAKGCKVTMSDYPFFFQFTYREYADNVSVKSFCMKELKAAKDIVEATCEALLSPKTDLKEKLVSLKQTLAPQDEASVKLPSGEAAMRALSLRLGNYHNPEVTRTVVFKMNFDGKETVWCPIGEFFGSGIGLNPFQGWYRTVAEDGMLSSRWVMPYRKTGSISLVNLGDEPVDIDLVASVGDWQWDADSMYFHAGWRGQYPVPTRPYSDWNYVTIKGRGVYVGDTLTVMNPVERWWGEGDEKIFVDGEDFPSIFGTGTEDYYAYSWGGRSTDFYEHPFHAQTFSHTYNKLHRKPKIDEKNTQGYSTETRTRSLDTMPFGSSLQLDMEVWSWTDCDMGYDVGVYWYGDAATTSNRKPEPVEVLNVPVIPGLENVADETSADLFNGAIEISPAQVLSKPETIQLKPQDLKKMKLKGVWNAGNHLLFKNSQVGDVVEIRIPATSPEAERLTLHATRSYDFGILRFSVNGKPAGVEVDLYGAKPVPSGTIKLGSFNPVDNTYLLRVEVIGKNPKSKGTFFGLDCVSLASAQ